MSYRTIRLPALLLIVALLGGMALFSIDTTQLFEGTPAPFRSDLRTLLGVAVAVLCLWIAAILAFERSDERFDRIDRGQQAMVAAVQAVAHRVADIENGRQNTEPLPPRMAIVGTAVVAAPVLVAPRIDPDVIDIATRLQGRISRGDDQ